MVEEGLTAAEFSAAVMAVTSAFGDPTRREIYLFARETDVGVTASEVAERFELHPNVARHHLDKLAAGGYLEVAVPRAAHAEARPGSLAIIAEQCPFGDAAVQHPVICAVDRGIVKGMLAGLYGDTVPHTEASRPQGDEVCVTSL